MGDEREVLGKECESCNHNPIFSHSLVYELFSAAKCIYIMDKTELRERWKRLANAIEAIEDEEHCGLLRKLRDSEFVVPHSDAEIVKDVVREALTAGIKAIEEKHKPK